MESNELLKEVKNIFSTKKYTDCSYREISKLFSESDVIAKFNAIAKLKKENSVASSLSNILTLFAVVVTIMSGALSIRDIIGNILCVFYLVGALALVMICLCISNLVARNTYVIEIAEKYQYTNTTDKMNNEQIREKRTYNTEEKLQENFGESTGFYQMVKRHANTTFRVAVISLFVGLVMYGLGFIGIIWFEKDVAIISLLAGSFTEVISGTVFLLHKKSIEELNELHKRLSSTERYLTSIMLAEELPDHKKEDAYRWILENCILTDVEIQTGVVMKWRHGDKAN